MPVEIADRLWLIALLSCVGFAGPVAFGSGGAALQSDVVEHSIPAFPGVALPSSARYGFQAPLVQPKPPLSPVHAIPARHWSAGGAPARSVSTAHVAAERPRPSLFERVSYRTTGPPLPTG